MSFENGATFSSFGTYIPFYVDRIWLWDHYNKIPIYPIFYLLNADSTCYGWMRLRMIPVLSLEWRDISAGFLMGPFRGAQRTINPEPCTLGFRVQGLRESP